MTFQARDTEIEEEKLEDILRSIRGIIDDHNQPQSKPINKKKTDKQDSSVLELTMEAGADLDRGIVSNKVMDRSSQLVKDFAQKLETGLYQPDNRVDVMMTDLLKPLLKEWLDNNLPRLVEKVIAEEIKKMIPRR